MPDVVVFGLDGFEPSLFERWEDELPNLKRLKKEGVYAKLTSTTPPLSSPAWAAFSTGLDPGTLGIFGFNPRKEDSYERETVNFSHWNQHVNLWNVLNANGYTTGIFSMPTTYPPEAVDGWMVANMPAPLNAADLTYPGELREELDEVVDGYEMETPKSNRDTDDVTMMGERWRVMEKQHQAAKHLFREHPVDMFLYVIAAPDRISHYYWKYMDDDHPQHEDNEKLADAIKTTYVKADEYVGEFLDMIDDDTYVFIMSDHGFGPKHGTFYLNQWLYDNGYLAYKQKPSTSLLARLGITKHALMRVLRRLNLEHVKELLPDAIARPLKQHLAETGERTSIESATIDWTQTKAFSLDAHSLWINHEDREPNGGVSEDEYMTLRDDIAAKLRKRSHPVTGEPLDVVVKSGEVVYEEEDGIPDLHVTIEDKLWDVGTSLGGDLFDTMPHENGDHRGHGIFIAAGPGIEPTETESADITAVTPTILTALSVPLHEAMTDSPIEPVTTAEPEHRTYQKTEDTFEWSDVEEEAIKKRLQGLGYLE